MEKATKKTYLITILLGAVLVACLWSSGEYRGAVSEDFQLDYGFGSAYTQEDMDAAAAKVKRYFKNSYGGCTLYNLRYEHDLSEETLLDYDADEGIEFVGDYSYDGESSMVYLPHQNMKDWRWTVVKSDGGRWRVANAGWG